jgi:transposase
VLSNGHAGFGGRSGETHQRKRRQGAPGRPNLAEGKTRKEALRSLKRQISDAIFACLQADARQAAAHANGPGGQPGNDSVASAAGSHPTHRLFGQATPGPGPTLRPRSAPRRAKAAARKPRRTS